MKFATTPRLSKILSPLLFLTLTACTIDQTGGSKHPLSVHEDDHLHHENEILVLDPAPGYEKTLPALGLRLIEIVDLESMGSRLYHLEILDGSHPFDVRAAHKKTHPETVVDVHHHFEQHQNKRIDKSYTSRKAANWESASAICGNGIKIGMVDGGVDLNHAAFKNRKLTFRSFHLKGQKIGALQHGTAVASVFLGTKNWAGLLPRAELFAANVFHKRIKGNSRASAKSILLAVNWLIKQNVQVINLSIGGAFNALIDRAIKKAHKKGILMIASAGNNGPFNKKRNYPGAYTSTIAIAASDRFDRSAKFSSAGNYVEYTAPGVGIWTAVPNGGKAMSGTSFSAPIVSSFVAMALQTKKIKTLKEARLYLRKHAFDRGKEGWDKYTGWGIVKLAQKC